MVATIVIVSFTIMQIRDCTLQIPFFLLPYPLISRTFFYILSLCWCRLWLIFNSRCDNIHCGVFRLYISLIRVLLLDIVNLFDDFSHVFVFSNYFFNSSCILIVHTTIYNYSVIKIRNMLKIGTIFSPCSWKFNHFWWKMHSAFILFEKSYWILMHLYWTCTVENKLKI